MKLKKILAFILAAQMMLGATVACTQNEDPKETNPPKTETKAPETKAPETQAPETEAPETKFDRLSVPDDLPETTFNGQDVRILCNPTEMFELFSEDGESGDNTSRAVYERNNKIESRFDVKIQVIPSGSTDNVLESQDKFRPIFQAGDYQWEIIDLWQRMSLDIPGNHNGFYNLLEVPHLNFDKPWYNKRSNDDSTFNGKMWTVTSSLSLTSMMYAYTFVYNKDLVKEFGFNPEEIDQMVFDGKWTLDKLIEMTSEFYRDDGDGLKTPGSDIFGFGSDVQDRVIPWVTGFDERAVSPNEDRTKLEITLGSEKVYSALEKLYNFHYNTKGAMAYQGGGALPGGIGLVGAYGMNNNALITDFNEGRVGFMTSVLNACYSTLRDVNFEYGLMPFPKYDEAQENYYTNPNYDYTVYAIPANIPEDKLEMTAVVFEALSAESWKTVYPAYYDDALKGRYSTDENMAKMVDLIVDGIVYDYSYQTAIWMRPKLAFMFQNCLGEQNPDLASQLAESKDHLDNVLAGIMHFYGIPMPEGVEPLA